MSTQSALRAPPSLSSTKRPAPSARSPTVLHGEQLGAEAARLVGAAPREIRAAEPGREAEVVLDAARLAACPPGASRSTMIVRRPSEAPYTAAASPAGPPPRWPGRSGPGPAGRRRRVAPPAPGRSGARARCRPPAAPPAGGRPARRPPSAARAPRRRARRPASGRARGCGPGSRAARGSPWRSGARRAAHRRTPARRPLSTSSAGPRRPGTAAPPADPAGLSR